MSAPPDTRPRLFARGEPAAGACALALLISMFALKWFGVDPDPTRPGATVTAVDAWNGMTLLAPAMLATIVLTIGSLVLHVSQRRHGAKTDSSLLVAAATTVLAALVAYRVLIDLPRPAAIVDQKLGALIGLAWALGLAGCAWQWARDARRARVLTGGAPVHRPRPAMTGEGAGPRP